MVAALAAMVTEEVEAVVVGAEGGRVVARVAGAKVLVALEETTVGRAMDMVMEAEGKVVERRAMAVMMVVVGMAAVVMAEDMVE